MSSWRHALVPTALLSAGIAACGGGGGGGATFTVGFSAPAFDLDEDGGALSISVTLQGPPGAVLAEAASVVVADTGAGTATSGADYASFPAQTIVLPPGTAVGAQIAIAFEPLSDALVEGQSETVVLALSAPTGADLAAQAQTSVQLIDADSATLRFNSASQWTPDEATATHTAVVQLLLPGGNALAVDLGVDVSDDGTGTSTSGLDYGAFATTRVTFAAGSPAGATQAVGIVVQDDALTEGNESVCLALGAPDPGAAIGGISTHVLVIQDDETPSGQFLYASHGPGGTDFPLADNSAVALGSQTVGLGPNAGTLVRLSNLGTVALGVAAPLMAGANPEDFSIELESSSLPPPGEAATDAGFVLPPDAPAPVGREIPVELGLAFELEPALLAELESVPAVTLHGFPLPGRSAATLALSRVELPFSEDAVLLVDGAPQPGGPRALLAGLSLWSGTVLEAPGSRVFLALSPAGAQGFVEFADGPERLVHLVTERAGALDGTPALVRAVEDGALEALGVLPPPEACAEARAVPAVGGPPGAPAGGALPGGGEPDIEAFSIVGCRLAIETDYQLYQRFGSTVALTSYVTSLIAAVSERYVTDVQARLTISYLGVYTTAGDPWSAQDSGGDAGDVLDEFRTAWTTSGWPAAAALAHFISGANLGGGVAYVGVLCNQSYGFGVSGNVVGNINWGAWTGASASFTWDFVVVAHELGHNFGAAHTHSLCPPLDQCYTNCSGTTACSYGTLMSYCHLCAGGMNNIELVFHPVTANSMRSTINTSCLGYSVLDPGDHVQYRVRFEPKSDAGPRSAELRFHHGAPNHPTPLRVQLSGQANP